MADTISLLLDITKVMIPVITGFILLFGGTIGKLWEFQRRDVPLKIDWGLVAVSLLSALISLSFFVGVMYLSVKSTMGIPQKIFFLFMLDQSALVKLAVTYSKFGYFFFVIAVAFATIFYLRIIKRSS